MTVTLPDNHPEELRRRHGIRVSGYDYERGAWADSPRSGGSRSSRSSRIAGAVGSVVPLVLKCLLAVCTFGVYPLAPWAIKVNNARLYRRDVAREQYRQQVRRAAREGRRR